MGIKIVPSFLEQVYVNSLGEREREREKEREGERFIVLTRKGV